MKLLLLLLGCLVAIAASDSNVLILDDSSFDEAIESNPLMLVKFFAPWCGHCKKLVPEYEKAAETLADEIPLAEVDCTEARDLCSRFDVRGFPTMMVFRDDGTEPSEYESGRDSEAIVKFMRKQNAPAFSVVSDADELSSMTSDIDELVVVAFLESEESCPDFITLAKQNRNDKTFILCTAEGAASKYGAEQGKMVVFKHFDEPNAVFKGEMSLDDMSAFLTAESFPIVGEIGPHNFQKYLDRELPLVWVFIDPESESTSSIESAMKEAATPFKGQLSVVKLDGVKWKDHAKHYGISDVPGMVIDDTTTKKKYLYDQDIQDSTQLSTFFKQFMTGDLQAHIKSEPVPESNDEPVKIVVGKSWDDIVMDDSKDVFVEFYAPWCGHCKSLQPEFDSLAQKLESVESLVMAKIDATENDTPIDISGFPTLMLFPAGDKQNPITYEQERTEEEMEKFLREHVVALESEMPEPEEATEEEPQEESTEESAEESVEEKEEGDTLKSEL